MATHSSILVRIIPWTEEINIYSPWGLTKLDTTEQLSSNSKYVTVLATQICPTVCKPMTVTHQATLSMKFSRQEYWSGLPCPSPVDLPNPRIKSVFPELQTDCLASQPPGDLPDPGIKPGSPTLEADALTSEPPGKIGKAYIHTYIHTYIYIYNLCYHRNIGHK